MKYRVTLTNGESFLAHKCYIADHGWLKVRMTKESRKAIAYPPTSVHNFEEIA